MKKKEQATERTNRTLFVLNLGWFAGVIWGAVKILFYYLGFTKVLPGFLAEPFIKHSVLANWYGHLVGWLFFIVFSLIASLIYFVCFKKVRGAWLGIFYGIAWWALLYGLIGPWTGMMKMIHKLDWNSISTDFCLFTLWGIFIGYTVALEFTEDRQREPFSNFDAERR